MHGFVRTEIEKHFPWKTATYGEPINITAALMTATVTGTRVIPYAEREGFRFKASEKEEIAMFTALQAHFQGIPAEYLPSTFEDFNAFEVWAVYHGGLPEHDDYDRCMSVLKPLIENGYPFTESRIQTAAFNAMIASYSRAILGDELCDQYRIPKSRIGNVIAVINRLVNRRLSKQHAERREDGAYCAGRRHWWFEHIPAMLESATGTAKTDYAQSANTK